MCVACDAVGPVVTGSGGGFDDGCGSGSSIKVLFCCGRGGGGEFPPLRFANHIRDMCGLCV